MRISTVLSLVISALLALVAVFGVRLYLVEQRDRMASLVEKKVEKSLVVALKPMRYGDRILAENLQEIPWSAATLPAGAFASVADLVGEEGKERYAMEAIDPGEPILSSKVTGAGERASLSAAIDKGKKAVSIRVNDVLGVAGFIRPSDRVDVLLTRTVKTDGDDQTFVDVLLQGVRVLAVDQIADERSDKPSIVKTVTFEVSTEEAQRLTLGANVGTLSLALRNLASSDIEETRQVTAADLGGGLASEELKEATKAADNSDGKLQSIESLVKKVGDDLGARIDSVEGKLTEKKPVVENKVVVVEKKVMVEPPKPAYSTIGVWNKTTREEHRVDQSE